ncbi:MAG TPA: type II secretion system F family protein [Terracidiphilus sp.]|nr:type II secretion system F family protein [Terracidiphilus sp.]
MLLPVVLAFVGAFVVTVLLLIAMNISAASRQSKRAAVALQEAVGSERQVSLLPPTSFRKVEQKMSAVPWLNTILSKTDFVPHLQKLLKEADLKWTVGTLFLMSLAAFAFSAYLLYLRLQSVIVSLSVGIVAGLLPFAFVFFKRQKRIEKFEQGLPNALDLMVSALRVGHSFTAAIGVVTRECPDPVGSEFKACYDEQNYGLDMRTALENLVERLPLQDLKIVVTAILIQRDSGGNLAELLEKAADVIRQRFRLRRQVMVHTAQGRLTGWILTLLPIFLGMGLYILNPKTMSLLWTRPLGVKMLIVAGCMLVVGTLLIQKIVRIDI